MIINNKTTAPATATAATTAASAKTAKAADTTTAATSAAGEVQYSEATRADTLVSCHS